MLFGRHTLLAVMILAGVIAHAQKANHLTTSKPTVASQPIPDTIQPLCLNSKILTDQATKLCDFFCTASFDRQISAGRRSETKYLVSRPLGTSEFTGYFHDLFLESRQQSGSDTIGAIFSRENSELRTAYAYAASEFARLSSEAAAKKTKAQALDPAIKKLHTLGKAQAVPGQNGGWSPEQAAYHSKLLGQQGKLIRDANKLLGTAAQHKTVMRAQEIRQDAIGVPPRGWRKSETLVNAFTLQTNNGDVTFEFAPEANDDAEPKRIFFATTPGAEPKLACDNSRNHIFSQKSQVADVPTYTLATLETWVWAQRIAMMSEPTDDDEDDFVAKFKGLNELCDWLKARSPSSVEEIKALRLDFAKSLFTTLQREWGQSTANTIPSTSPEAQPAPPTALAESLADAIPPQKPTWMNSVSQASTGLLKIAFPNDMTKRMHLAQILGTANKLYATCVEKAVDGNAGAKLLKNSTIEDQSFLDNFTEFSNRVSNLLLDPQPGPEEQAQLYESLSTNYQSPDRTGFGTGQLDPGSLDKIW